MEMLALLDGAFASTGRIIGSIRPDALGDPTPCSEWDVRALINHTTWVVARFERTAAGQEPSSGGPHDLVGTDPAAAFDRASAANLAAWSSPHALEGTRRLPIGEVPAEMAAGVNFIDTLVHGWDLATATGQDPALDPVLAGAALEFSRVAIRDDLRGPGKPFAPIVEVSAGASPTDQMVAFLGRQP
jgi:uncharacterized protein (TIGR03086 family)